jgi:hypothetical protein
LYLSRLSNSGQLTLPDFYQRALPRDARLAVIPIGEVLVIVPYDDAFAEMAVREQTHRHKQERTKLPADIVVQLLGLLVAAGIAGGGIYSARPCRGWGAVLVTSLAGILIGLVQAIRVIRMEREDLTKIELPTPEQKTRSKPSAESPKPRKKQ